MSGKNDFYVVYSREDGRVEFISPGDGRLKEMFLKGYEIIGHGRHGDIRELNRGIERNMRGMYEFEKRQNTELKIQLERALKVIREVECAIKRELLRRRRAEQEPCGETRRQYGAPEAGICGAGGLFNCMSCREERCTSEEYRKFWEERN